MKNTVIYLIRHAETINEDGIRNTGETQQEINEKEILSIKGEQDSKKLSENSELRNIDVIWCSSYTRAKQTAKYIANENNLQYNLDKRLCERKLGNREDLGKFMNDKTTRDPSREQLAFPDFKTRDGESANDTNKRMNEFISEITEKYEGKRIAVISHGGAIKFYLLNYCKVNEKLNLEYEEKELSISSPCLLKLTFRKNKLINLEQINNIVYATKIELWDVYDVNRKKLNKTINRYSNEKLREGEYHLVAEAIIINEKNEILISQRSAKKDKYPLLWECAGGAVKSGENSRQGIIRELNEELGLTFNDDDAIFYKEIRNDSPKNFKDIWLFKKDIEIDNIRFIDHEVVNVMWVTIEELESMKKQNMIVPKIELNIDEFKKILDFIKHQNK